MCETLLSCVKRLGGLTVTTLPGASRSFNPALSMTYTFTENVWLVFAPTVIVGFVRLRLDVKLKEYLK